MAPFQLSINNIEQKKAFALIMAHPDRLGLKQVDICKKFNISPATIYNRMRDPEIDKMIKEQRTALFKMELPKVDEGLRKKAFKGDVNAASLIYERWDDYDPKHNQSNTLVQVNITQSDGNE